MDKNLLRKYVEEEVRKVLIPIPTEERGIYYDFIDENYSFRIDEGLYKTYPPETAVRYIKQLFGLGDNQIGIYETNPRVPEERRLWCVYEDIHRNREHMERAMRLCGYTLSKEQTTSGVIEQIYIPINLPNIDKIVRNFEHITHVSPIFYKDKILSQGFVPKSTNVMFSYPERVFFFKGNTPPQEILFQVLDFDKKRTNKRNEHTYCLFTIDPKKIPSNVSFHTDLTYPFGIYTNDNVPPTCIKNTTTFNCVELLNKLTN